MIGLRRHRWYHLVVAILIAAAAIIAVERLATAPAQASNLVSLYGTITTSDGKAVSSGAVRVTDLDDPTNAADVQLMSDGRYYLLLRPTTRARIRLEAERDATRILPQLIFSTTAAFDLSTNRGLDISLPPLRKVTFHVTDADNNPIKGAQPDLYNCLGQPAAGTDTFDLATGTTFRLSNAGPGSGNLGWTGINVATDASGNTTRWIYPTRISTVASTLGVHGIVSYEPIKGFDYTQLLTSAIDIDTTAGDTTINIQRPRLVSLAGTVKTADGKLVVAGAVRISDLDDPTNLADAQLTSTGRYAVLMRATTRARIRVEAERDSARVLPDQLFITTDDVGLGASRALDLTLPPLRKVTFHITDDGGNPVKGAQPELINFTQPTEGTGSFELADGITFALTNRDPGGGRLGWTGINIKTDAYGNTTRWAYPTHVTTTGAPAGVYGYVMHPAVFGFSYAQRITEPIEINAVDGDTTVNIQRPQLVSIQGTVRTADGRAVASGHVTVTDLDDPANITDIDLSPKGKYFLLLQPTERARLRIEAGREGNHILPDQLFTTTDGLSLTANRTLDLTMPPLRKVTFHITDADSNPIKGARPDFVAFTQPVEGTNIFELAPGITFAATNRDPSAGGLGWTINKVNTDVDGNATRWAYPTNITTSLVPPGVYGYVTYPPINGFAYTQRLAEPVNLNTVLGDVTVSLVSDNFATIDSAGALFGDIIVTTPDDTGIDDTTSTPVVDPSGIPDGAYVLAGEIGYSVTDVEVGGTVDVTVALPAGATVTAVGKIIDGIWTPVPEEMLISNTGSRFVVRLTDGGWGDADGIANGTIVDPLVPVGPCNCRTPTAPGKPGAARGDRTATLKWSAAKSRGAAVRDHIVTYATSAKGPFLPVVSGTCAQRPVHTRICTVTNLIPGTSYWFRIAAVNAKGPSTNSPTTKLTAATTPGTVTITPTAVAPGMAKIGWTAALANGASINRYEFSVRPIGTDTWGPWRSTGTKRTATLTKLTPSAGYDVRVRAINAIGPSEPAAMSFTA